MGIAGVIFWGIVLRLVGYICVQATQEYAKSGCDTVSTIFFGCLTLFICGVIFFFNPYAILVFY